MNAWCGTPIAFKKHSLRSPWTTATLKGGMRFAKKAGEPESKNFVRDLSKVREVMT